MTLKETIGVNSYNVDIKTGKELTHEGKYTRVIDALGGLDKVIPFIPFTLEQIKKAIKVDKHLNNLSMKKWDAAAGFICKGPNCTCTYSGIWALYRGVGITSASCADGVCILKEAARQWIEREQ